MENPCVFIFLALLLAGVILYFACKRKAEQQERDRIKGYSHATKPMNSQIRSTHPKQPEIENTAEMPEPYQWTEEELTERITVKSKLDKFLNEAECQNEATGNLQKGELLTIKKFGKGKFKVQNSSSMSLGFINPWDSDILKLTGIDDVRCTVNRVIRGKTGNNYLHMFLDFNKREYEKACLTLESRTSPMPKEYFDLIENRMPLGKRDLSGYKRQSTTFIYRCESQFLYPLADKIIAMHVKAKRFRVLDGESNFLREENFDHKICEVKGIRFRTERAIEVARNLKSDDIVAIVPDIYNDYDENALAVFTLSGELIGYIDKTNAEDLCDEAQDIVEASVFTIEDSEYPQISLIVIYYKRQW